MREIKFRAWDKEAKCWIKDDITIAFDGVIRILPLSESAKLIPVDKVEIYQYTGLKDKNGVEICEGDKLQIEIRDWNTGKVIVSINQVVEFKNCKFGVMWGVTRKDFTGLDSFSDTTTFEVIGNIHDKEDAQ